MRLQGKAAIVTGGGSGIGRAIALKLAREGAMVVVGDLNLPAAESVAQEIKASGQIAIAVKCDVSKREEVEQMAKATLSNFKTIDILVNNAGFFESPTRFMNQPEEKWHSEIGVTFLGTLNCCKAVLPHMVEQKSGRIVNITSDAGKVSTPGFAIYSGCKAGVAGFSRALAGEVAGEGILINCVAPGAIATPGADRFMSPKAIESMIRGIPLRRRGAPEEVADMVAFLASDEAKYITGQQISVSGGMTMT